MDGSKERTPVVVGVDGSPDSQRAVEWAMRLARREERPVTLLHAGDGRRGREPVDRAEEIAHALAPDVVVRRREVTDGPRQALLSASRSASVVVLGARGTGPLSHLRLGSVAHAVTRRAACPVVVTRTAGADRRPGVVAGFDLQPSSRDVLDFAFRVAEARSWPVTLLHCFWDSTGETGDLDAAASTGLPERHRLCAAAAECATAHPGVEVRTLLSRGFADRRLLAATLDCALVVVGHRELPWLEALVYGHVTPVVVEHAVGDVAVVPLTSGGEASR